MLNRFLACNGTYQTKCTYLEVVVANRISCFCEAVKSDEVEIRPS